MTTMTNGSDRTPIFLDLAGRRTVVVGGGPVAARRTLSLLDGGASVVVVAPALCEDLAQLADRVTWLARDYSAGDLDGAWLVHTATGDRAVDDRVTADAEAARVWCVRADDAGASPAWVPAVTKVDDITVAVSSGGDPRRSQAIRSAIATGLETGDLPVRRQRRPAAGSVALVGGGPGDPGLITTRGRRLLADADVVVVDRLAPRELLDLLDPSVEVVEAGKGPKAHTLTQDQINELLVERALAGQRVVRLKGGDPFVFGRGGEEAEACAEAGVPCEVVPGVTSAIAVPAAAGIPVTHRGVSRSFTVVSAHGATETDNPDWAALARAGGTLVILMGVAPLAEVAESLVAAGRPATTPVAIVERGTLPTQRTTRGTLATIAELAATREVRAPAVIVVGPVVAVGDNGADGP
jgi:uroporphyrin-III C-methyltransferase/precorrin-2 dehydrogenase/sirohydrochlorin ferrochelatase